MMKDSTLIKLKHFPFCLNKEAQYSYFISTGISEKGIFLKHTTNQLTAAGSTLYTYVFLKYLIQQISLVRPFLYAHFTYQRLTVLQ